LFSIWEVGAFGFDLALGLVLGLRMLHSYPVILLSIVFSTGLRTWLRASWKSDLFFSSSNSPSKAALGLQFNYTISFSPFSLILIILSRFFIGLVG